MKKLGFIFLVMLIPAIAIAQVATGTATGTVTVAIVDLVNDGVSVVKGWGDATVLVSLLGIVNLLVNITKFGPVGKLIKDKKLKWIRPLLSVIAGALVGAIGALTTGATVLNAIVVGIGAGLGSVGFHELWDSLTAKRAEAKT